jgi:hypothetical protein
VALSRDGQLVASGGDDGMIRLCDAKTGAAVRALRSEHHYERLDIASLTGVIEAHHAALFSLGATERLQFLSRQGENLDQNHSVARLTSKPQRAVVRRIRINGFV